MLTVEPKLNISVVNLYIIVDNSNNGVPGNIIARGVINKSLKI